MIRLNHISKVYPGSHVSALEDVNIHIGVGEFITVVGPSGCGKTTLLNLLAEFEQPTSGAMIFDPDLLDSHRLKRTMVFQQATLLPWMNVRDNVAFGLRIQHGKRHIDYRQVDEFIGIMGLSGFEGHKVYQLSGGMQQRVAIARALITAPRIILMDEPFGALDAMTRSDLQQFLLSTWHRLKPTVVFVTHDIDEAILLGTRVLVFTPRPGRLARDLPVHLPGARTPSIALTAEFAELKAEILGLLHPGRPNMPRMEEA